MKPPPMTTSSAGCAAARTKCSRPSASRSTISDADLLAQYQTQRYQPLHGAGKRHAGPGHQNPGRGPRGQGLRLPDRAAARLSPRPELAHVLGYLSRDQQRNRGKYLSGDVIYDRYKGASGIEEVYNQELTGKDGSFMISTTPDGYARSAAVAEPATYGNNVRLSIDSKIQAAVETAMATSPRTDEGRVMMDVHTGDVVAMASQPTFDPNIFVPTIAADEWNVLNTDEFNPAARPHHPRAVSARLELQDRHLHRRDERRRLRSQLGRPLHRLLRHRQRPHGPARRKRRRDLPRGPDLFLQHLLRHPGPEGRAATSCSTPRAASISAARPDQPARRTARPHPRQRIRQADPPARIWRRATSRSRPSARATCWSTPLQMADSHGRHRQQRHRLPPAPGQGHRGPQRQRHQDLSRRRPCAPSPSTTSGCRT